MKVLKNLLVIMLIAFSMFGMVSAAGDYSYSKLSETLLNQDPDPVQPGDYVELRFKVEKEGNDVLSNIKYELVPEYPFSFDGSDKPIKSLGDWIGTSDDEEFYILYYKLKVDEKALEGSYELTLKQTSAGVATVKEVKFDVRVDERKSANLLIGKVETSPSKLIADYDEGLVKVEVVNVGDEKAEQVIVNLNLPEGFDESFGYSTRANLGTIDAGASKVAEFYVDTKEGVLKGNHEATLDIQYKEDEDNSADEVKEVSYPFAVQVFGRPEYKILSSEVSDLIPGKSGEIRLKIQNVGSRESDSTSIQVFKDSSQPFDFTDKSDFIGKMDVNSEGEVVFAIDVDSDATPKEYKLKLQIRSVVDSDVLTEDETISVVINDKEAPTPGDNLYFRLGMYALFLVIGVFVGRRFFGRKTKK